MKKRYLLMLFSVLLCGIYSASAVPAYENALFYGNASGDAGITGTHCIIAASGLAFDDSTTVTAANYFNIKATGVAAAPAGDTSFYPAVAPRIDVGGGARIICGTISIGAWSNVKGMDVFAISDSVACGGIFGLKIPSGAGTATTWFWQFSANNDWTAGNCSVISADKAIFVRVTDEGYYRVVTVKNCDTSIVPAVRYIAASELAQCCPTVTSWTNSRNLSVSAADSFCAGKDFTLTVPTPTYSTGGSVYDSVRWYYTDGTFLTSKPSATGSSYTVTSAPAGTKTYRAILVKMNSGTRCLDTTNSRSVTINSLPDVSAQASSASISPNALSLCNGDTASITLNITGAANTKYYYNWGKSANYNGTGITYGNTAADSGRSYKINTANVPDVAAIGGVSKTYFYVKVMAKDTVSGCSSATAINISVVDTVYRVNCGTLPPKGEDTVNGGDYTLGGNSVFVSCSYEDTRNTVRFNLLNTAALVSAHKGIATSGIEYFNGSIWTQTLPSAIAVATQSNLIDTVRQTLKFNIQAASQSPYAEKIHTFRAFYTREGSATVYYTDSARFYVNSVMTPAQSVTFTPADTTVCDGSEVILTASAVKGNARYKNLYYVIRDTVNAVSWTSTASVTASMSTPVKHYLARIVQDDEITVGSTTHVCWDTTRSSYAVVRTDSGAVLGIHTYNGVNLLTGITLCGDDLSLSAFGVSGQRGIPVWRLKRSSDGVAIDSAVGVSSYIPVGVGSPVSGADSSYTLQIEVGSSAGVCSSVSANYNIRTIRPVKAGAVTLDNSAICSGGNINVGGSALGASSLYRFAFDFWNDTSTFSAASFESSAQHNFTAPLTVSSGVSDSIRYTRFRVEYITGLSANGINYTDVCKGDTSEWVSVRLYSTPVSNSATSTADMQTLCVGTPVTLNFSYTDADSIAVYCVNTESGNSDTSISFSVGSGSSSVTVIPRVGVSRYYWQMFNNSVSGACSEGQRSTAYINVEAVDSTDAGDLHFSFGGFNDNTAVAFYGDVITIKGDNSNGSRAVLFISTADNFSPADLSVWDSVNTGIQTVSVGYSYTFSGIAMDYKNRDTSYYRVRVNGIGDVCPAAYSDTIKLVLYQHSDIKVRFSDSSRTTTRYCEGSELEFTLYDGENYTVDSVVAGSVQWEVSKDGGFTFTPIPQGTGLNGRDTLKLTAADHATSGRYYYRVKYKLKPSLNSFTSDSVAIDILRKPSEGNLSFALGGQVCLGTCDTLRVSGLGDLTGTVITWQYSRDTNLSWWEILLKHTDVDTNDLTRGIHDLNSYADTGFYRIFVSTYAECPSAFTNTVHFKVNNPAVAGYVVAAPASVLYGGSAEYELRGFTGTPWEWLQQNVHPLIYDVSYSYAGNLELTNITNREYVSAVVLGEGVCPDDTTDGVSVEVYDTLVAEVQPKTIELLSSARYFNVSVDVSNAGLFYYDGASLKDLYGEGLMYQWYSRCAATGIQAMVNTGGLVSGAVSATMIMDSAVYHANPDICFFARVSSATHPSYRVYSDTACIKYITDIHISGDIEKTVSGECWMIGSSATYFIRATGDSVYYKWELWSGGNVVPTPEAIYSAEGDTITFPDNTLFQTADSLTVKVYDRNNKLSPLTRSIPVCVVPPSDVHLYELVPYAGTMGGDTVCAGNTVTLYAYAELGGVPEVYGKDYVVTWLVRTGATAAGAFDTVHNVKLSGNTYFVAGGDELEIITHVNQDSILVRALYNFTKTAVIDNIEDFVLRVSDRLSTSIVRGDSAFVGSAFNLRAYASGGGVHTPVTYEWYRGASASGLPYFSQTTTDTSVLSGIAADSLAGLWTVVASSAGTCVGSISANANLTVLSDCSVILDSVFYDGRKVLSGITLCGDALPVSTFTVSGIKGVSVWRLRSANGSIIDTLYNTLSYTPSAVVAPLNSPDTFYTVELSASSGGVCTHPVTVTESYNITVIRPVAVGTFDISGNALCSGGSVTLSGTAIGGTGSAGSYYRYAFDFAADTLSFVPASYQASGSVAYGTPYTVSGGATDTLRYSRMRVSYNTSLYANGISYNSACASDTSAWASVKILPAAGLTATSTYDGATLCTGTPITINFTLTHADSIAIYCSNSGDTSLIASSSTASITLMPKVGLNKYYFTAFNSGGLGCGAGTSGNYVSVLVSDSVVAGNLSFDFGAFTGSDAEAYYGDVIVLRGSGSSGLNAVLERTCAFGTAADLSAFDSVHTAPAYIVGGGYSFQNLASHANNGDTSYYRVRVSGTGDVCPAAYTNTVKIVFYQNTDLHIAFAEGGSADARLCESSAADFVLVGGTGTSVGDVVAGSVKWEVSLDGGNVFSPVATGMNGTDTLKVPATAHAVSGVYTYRAIYTVSGSMTVDTTGTLSVTIVSKPSSSVITFALGGKICLGATDSLRLSGVSDLSTAILTGMFSRDTNAFWLNVSLDGSLLNVNDITRGIHALDNYVDTGYYRLCVSTVAECPAAYSNTVYFTIDHPANAGYVVALPEAVLYGGGAQYEVRGNSIPVWEWFIHDNDLVINNYSVPYTGNLSLNNLTHKEFVSSVAPGVGVCGNDTSESVYVEVYDTLTADVPDVVELLSSRRFLEIPVSVAGAGLFYYDGTSLKDLYGEGVTYQWYMRTDAGGVQQLQNDLMGSPAVTGADGRVLYADTSLYHAQPDLRFFCKITSLSHPSYFIYSDTARIVYIEDLYVGDIQKPIVGDCWLIGTSATYFVHAVGDSVYYQWELHRGGISFAPTGAVFSASGDTITFPDNTIFQSADSLVVRVYDRNNMVIPVTRRIVVCVVQPATRLFYELNPNSGRVGVDTVYWCEDNVFNNVYLFAHAERGGQVQIYGRDYLLTFVVRSTASGSVDTIHNNFFVRDNNMYAVDGAQLRIISYNERDNITVWAHYNFHTTSQNVDYVERFDLRIVSCHDTVTRDTLYCIKGRVYGLPDNSGVRINYRVISAIDDSNSTDITTYTLTSTDSTYSICGLHSGDRVQVSAQNKDGFMVREYYGNIRISDTLFGIDFHYDSIPAGYYVASGIVYVEDVPSSGVEVYYNVGGTLYSCFTDIYGKYTIVQPGRTSFSIHPTYMDGYKVSPASGYSIVQIDRNSTGSDFYYTPLSSADTVSYLCGIIEGLPSPMLKNQLVTAIVQGVVYYALTGERGGYCFRGVPSGSIVVVIPPDVADYEHTPYIRTVQMPAHDTIIPSFVYSSLYKDSITLCGTVSGLAYNGDVLVSYFINEKMDSLHTDANGTYCIKALKGDYVRIVPSNQEGYRFLPNMYALRADSSQNIYDIEYILIDSGSVDVSGVVFKDGEIFDGAFVHYIIAGGSGVTEGVAMTDVYGRYYINGVEKGSNVRVTPDYVRNHVVAPAFGYIENLQRDTVLDTFFYTYFADTVQYSVSGTLFGLSSYEQANLNVRYFVNGVEGYNLVFTNTNGRYIIDSLPDSTYITVLAPVVAGYDVYPSEYSDILVAPSYNGANFVYIRKDTSNNEDARFTVSGTLYGLPASLRANLNIEYYVNGMAGAALLTGSDGKYSIDSLRNGTLVTVIAPAVEGYMVFPSQYTEIHVSPSYYGANFVYVSDTSALDTARLEMVVINDQLQTITDIIHYILPCNDRSTSVDVVLTVSDKDTIYRSDFAYTGELEYTYTVDMTPKALYRVDTVTVVSTASGTAGQLTHTYIIIVEKRFAFYDIVTEYIEDYVFMVNNNPVNNGGYSFVSYQWYKDGVPCGNDQVLTSGSSWEEKFSNSAEALYRVELVTDKGEFLQTCEDRSGVTVYANAIYPNPVQKSGKVHFAVSFDLSQGYHTAVLYNMQGIKIWERSVGQISGGFNVPSASGTYILLLKGDKAAKYLKYKLIVK